MTDVRVFPEADALAETVAEALIGLLSAVQAEGRVPVVALTGGGITARVHRAVAASLDSLDVDWSAVDFWFGDERYVDGWSDQRNAVQARRDLLEPLGVDPARVHEMPAADSGMTLEEAATAYSDVVRADGSGCFDLVMLGLGPDGHVASLFPGNAALDVDDRIAVAVPDSPKPPPERISLTFPALNRSRAVWFVVSGEEKAEAVARALAEDTDLHDVPAVGVSPQFDSGETVWWLDSPAAARL